MSQAFHLGGWGMYPTTLAGLILVFVAFRYAARPERRRLDLIRCLSVLTVLVSCLGFVAGVIRTFISAPEQLQELGSHVVIGVGESLTNIGLGLVMLVVAWIATSIGAARSAASPRASGADLADPHAP